MDTFSPERELDEEKKKFLEELEYLKDKLGALRENVLLNKSNLLYAPKENLDIRNSEL